MTTSTGDVAGRGCEWCGEPFPSGMRIDACTRCCSKRCRQKLARFRVAPAGAVAVKPIRVGYFDPPYIGFAKKLYGCPEVDHEQLVDRACIDFPDGWALSAHSTSLLQLGSIIWPLAAYHKLDTSRLRVAAWKRGPRSTKSSRARNAWEPVIVYGGRPLELETTDRLDDVLDWSYKGKSPDLGVIGSKPPAFCEWLFRMLGLQRGDTLVDVFPGSGAVTRAYRLYQREPEQVDVRVRRPSRFEGSQQGDTRR